MKSLFELYEEMRKLIPEEEPTDDSSQLLKKVYERSRTVDWEKAFSHETLPETDQNIESACAKLRDQGTKCYQNNKFKLAVEHYNSYLRMCQQLSNENVNKKQIIFQGYSNRSAVLFKAQNFQKCSEDIEAALDYSDQDPKKEYLLYDRLAKCNTALGQKDAARTNFKLSLEKLESMKELPEQLRSAFKNQVESNLTNLEEMKITESAPIPRIAFEAKSADNKGLSKKTKIMYSEDQGRYLVATETIFPGEIVALETPNVSFTHFDFEKNVSKACHNCLEKIHYDEKAIYPSPFIDGVLFCSYGCLKDAVTTYHKHDIFIWKDYIKQMRENKEDLEKSGCMFLAFRSISRKPAAFFSNAFETFLNEDPTHGIKERKDFDKDKIQLMNLYNLVRHESEVSPRDRIQAAIRSIILIESLKRTKYFSAQSINDENLAGDIKLLADLLYRLQLSITFNVYLMYQVSGNLSGDIPLRMIGSAVYDHLILLNHSCAPNTTRFNRGGELIFVAKRTIFKDEEICSNYGIHHNNLTTEQRRAALREDYKFECQCEACKKNYPSLTQMETKLPSKVNKQLEALMGQYQRCFKIGDIQEARLACSKYLTKLEQAKVTYPHRNYEMGAIALNSCWWAILAQMEKA